MSPGLNVTLKFIWYLFSRLLAWAAAAGLVALAFFAAMDYMNASTLTKDGLQVRAQVIIEGSGQAELNKVFSKGFLESDTMLSSNVYRQYEVKDFDYNADTDFALVFPWQSTVTLRVTEKVSNIQASFVPSDDSGLSEDPPAWQNADYNVTLARYQGSWRITGMKLIRVLPAPTPSPTPSPSVLETETASPIPAAS